MKSWLPGGCRDGAVREDDRQLHLDPPLEIFGFPLAVQPGRRGLGKRVRESPGETGPGFIKRQALARQTDGTIIITVAWRCLPTMVVK